MELALSQPRPLPVAAASDYDVIRRTIEFISDRWRKQPSLEEIAVHAGTKPAALHRLFARWAGLTPKAFLQAVTLDHARTLLAQSASILEASYELGLSGPGRLHDLFITHHAMTPGAYKAGGEGLELRYGFHPSPFGAALVMITGSGLAGLAFADAGGEGATLADMKRQWPRARYAEDTGSTARTADRVFDPAEWRADRPLRVTLIGSDFEVRVWEVLLTVPLGQATTYSSVAKRIGRPAAARAVGAAVGRNPISFVVPCHRVLGKGGGLTGYRWGLTRKRAILGWEAGVGGAGPS
jgi:AraC family transcriptional regulator of adaptative response/methylated-DNA-[protein]-cysteine methyltransferase